MSYVPPSNLVLSIYPTSRGFGYVLFEGALSPFVWGVKETRGNGKNTRILKFLEKLIDRYAPAVLVLEDWTDNISQRVARIYLLYAGVLALAARKTVAVVRCSFAKVRQYFAYRNATNKYEIALHIAKIIPEFSHRIPPKRSIWSGDDARQALYDAAALGLTFYAETAVHKLSPPPR